MTVKIDKNGKILVHVPVMHGGYSLQDHLEKTYSGTPVKGNEMEKCLGADIAAKMMRLFLEEMPDTAEFISGSHYEEDYYFDIESFYGTPEELRSGAEAYLEMFIPEFHLAEGEEQYLDYLPSATEEFVFLCQQIGCTDLVQRLYDGIWAGHAIYNPFIHGEADLYRFFDNIEGLTLHKDHPKDEDNEADEG